MNSTGVPYDDPAGDFGEADEDGFAVGGAQITKPGPHDVLLGRGGGTNNHFGNVKFRKLVNEHKMRYLACSKVDKPKVAREVVEIWRKMNPPGRFLARKDESKKGPGSVKDSNNVWLEVGDKKAREKASQCLRERTPDVLPYIKQLRQQQDQMTEHGVAVVQQQLQMQQQVNGGIDGDMKLNSPGMMNVGGRPSVSALARRGSLPVVPSSVASSTIPTIHSSASRRTSLPTVSNLQGSSNMQMNNMMRQQQQLHHRAMNEPFLQERHAGLLHQQEFNMSPRLLTERSLMMQQQYGITDMPSMASANMYNQQARMMSPQSNNPRPVLSMQPNGGHLMTPQPHMMSPQPNAVRSYPLSTGALNNRLNPQLQMMQQLPQQPPLVQDLEPLPYDDGEGGNQLLPVPDVATSIPNSQVRASLPQGAAKRQIQKDPAAQRKVAGSSMLQGAKEPKRAPPGRLKQDDMQPLPMDAKQAQQKQKSKPSKGPNESRSNNPKAPIPGHVDDGELTLREYRKTLEEYITNHQIAAPPADVLEDDPENEFALEGLDTSAWIQQALNNDDSGSDLMESAGSVGEPKGRRGMLSTQKSQKSLMSTGTSYMSMAMSEMDQSGNDDTATSGAGLSREAKMNMSRSMKSDHSLMSELTDFSTSEIL